MSDVISLAEWKRQRADAARAEFRRLYDEAFGDGELLRNATKSLRRLLGVTSAHDQEVSK